MKTQDFVQLGKGALATSSGIIAGNVVRTKLVEPHIIKKLLPSMVGNALISNAIVAALGAVGYLFKDKVLPKQYHAIVEDICMGMMANASTNIIGGAFGESTKKTLGLSGLGEPGRSSYPTAMNPIVQPNRKALPAPLPLAPSPALLYAQPVEEGQWTVI